MNGTSAFRNAFAGAHVAGDGARLDQRRPLPVLAVPLVVELGVLAGERQRMAGQMRAQPQVGPEDVAVLVPGLEQVDQAARQPDAERHRAFAAAVAQALAVEEDDEVDVAREIQLAGTQLAHAEHEHAAAPGVRDLDLAAAHAFAQQVIERLLHRAVGEGGQGRGDPLHRPEPVEVAQADQQRLPPPGAAQAGHETGALVERHRVLLGAQSIQAPSGPCSRNRRRTWGSVHSASPRKGLPEKIPPSSASSRSKAARMNAASPGSGVVWARWRQRFSPRSARAGSAGRGGGRFERRNFLDFPRRLRRIKRIG